MPFERQAPDELPLSANARNFRVLRVPTLESQRVDRNLRSLVLRSTNL